MPVKICTIGYERRSLEDFLSMLKKNGVEKVIDVRADVASRREEFGEKLGELIRACGIEYVSIPALGIPRQDRIRPRLVVLREYEADLYGGRKPQTRELLEAVNSVNVAALLCYELNAARCHRRSLAHWLSKKTGCKVVNL